MHNPISFMSANFVARQLNYNMTQGWMQGDDATNAWFKPIATFEERFADMLREVRDAGFDAIDIWLAHLHPEWATADHVKIAQAQLGKFGLRVASLAGGFGNTLDQVERSCNLAVALGTTVLGGSTGLLQANRAALAGLLRKHGVKFGYENHPGDTSADLVLAKIGDGDPDVIGACVDTGWFGTYGSPAPAAIETLGDRIFHVHLKDVKAAGGHETCAYGQGVVDIQGSVRALGRLGYAGGLSIEHEPEHHNPVADAVMSAALVRGWMA